MKMLFAGLVALPFLAGVAMAGELAPLSDTQLDQVTAGLSFSVNNALSGTQNGATGTGATNNTTTGVATAGILPVNVAAAGQTYVSGGTSTATINF
jgi:hypothetical protein